MDRGTGFVNAKRAKTGQPRRIPINVKLQAILDEAGRVRHVSDRVFLNDRGQPWTINGIHLAMRRCYRKAGVTVTGRFKALRHTFCTRLLRAGAPAKAVADLMEHSTTALLDTYGHMTDESLRAAMSVLDDLVESDAPAMCARVG